jgi:hypothetical protein
LQTKTTCLNPVFLNVSTHLSASRFVGLNRVGDSLPNSPSSSGPNSFPVKVLKEK